ncbi:MAG: hypothetical protein NZL85_02755 [Fimbriimonadales bacterium]|nr:hypothetical protein [Fimbriimonadales bacterium]
MNVAQQHLLLNHLPVVGSLFCLLLLAYGLARRSVEVQKTALGALVLVALLTIPTYLTGEPAEKVLEHLPGFSETYVEPHESMAKIALVASLVLGVLALGGLLLSRGRAVPTALLLLILLGNLATFGLMAYTAHLGGQIRHTEIRSEAQPPPASGETGKHEEHE